MTTYLSNMAKAKPTANMVDAAFKELCALRKRYNFPEIQNSSEASDQWTIAYNMTHSSLSRIRVLVTVILTHLPRIPWGHCKD